MTEPSQLHIAEHEATHAVVARSLGLPVLWVSIVPGYDKEEDIHYPAATKIRDEAEQDQRLVLAAMAAPSFVPTADEFIDAYAELEAGMAYRRAEELGLDPERIRFDAKREAREGLAEIEALAEQLVSEGRVEFAVAGARAGPPPGSRTATSPPPHATSAASSSWASASAICAPRRGLRR